MEDGGQSPAAGRGTLDPSVCKRIAEDCAEQQVESVSYDGIEAIDIACHRS